MLAQNKRNRDTLRPFLLEAGILPDPMLKDPDMVTMTHLQKLAKGWGLTKDDPDFLRRFTNEKALCQVLADHSTTLTRVDATAQVCKCAGVR